MKEWKGFFNPFVDYKQEAEGLFNTILIILQLFLTLVMGIYFFNMLRSQHNGKAA